MRVDAERRMSHGFDHGKGPGRSRYILKPPSSGEIVKKNPPQGPRMQQRKIARGRGEEKRREGSLVPVRYRKPKRRCSYFKEGKSWRERDGEGKSSKVP